MKSGHILIKHPTFVIRTEFNIFRESPIPTIPLKIYSGKKLNICDYNKYNLKGGIVLMDLNSLYCELSNLENNIIRNKGMLIMTYGFSNKIIKYIDNPPKIEIPIVYITKERFNQLEEAIQREDAEEIKIQFINDNSEDLFWNNLYQIYHNREWGNDEFAKKKYFYQVKKKFDTGEDDIDNLKIQFLYNLLINSNIEDEL